MVTALDAFNVAISAAAARSPIYLLYSSRYVVGHRRFFSLITSGLFLVVIGGPFLALVFNAIRLGIHGSATLFIAIGLYDLKRVEIAMKRDWENLPVNEETASEFELAEPAVDAAD